MNALDIQMVGMSRSGNHAIANWIFAQAGTPKLLLNCAEGKTDPFLTCRPLDTGLCWRAEPAIDPDAARARRSADRALLMHSYEDSWLGHAFSVALERNHDRWLGPSRRRIDLLVLRDPFNLFASRLRMGAGLSPDVARRMWKQHAREALGATRRLRNDPVVVLYNRWASDPGYRREIADRLGLRFSDRGFDEVSACAGGSSFDGVAFDGRASRMATGERWRSFVGDAHYRRHFDAETVAMAQALFGFAPLAAVEADGPCVGSLDGLRRQERSTREEPEAARA